MSSLQLALQYFVITRNFTHHADGYFCYMKVGWLWFQLHYHQLELLQNVKKRLHTSWIKNNSWHCTGHIDRWLHRLGLLTAPCYSPCCSSIVSSCDCQLQHFWYFVMTRNFAHHAVDYCCYISRCLFLFEFVLILVSLYFFVLLLSILDILVSYLVFGRERALCIWLILSSLRYLFDK